MSNNVAVDFILDVDNTGFNTAMAGASKSVKGFMGTAAGLIGGSVILGGIGTAAVAMAADFEQSFAKVSTLFGDVEVDTNSLKTQILDLSTQTGIAATELNEGLYSALSAGIPVTRDMTEAMGFLEQATKLSVAGFTSTEKAVDVATTVLNAYGLEASETDRVMNTLIETQNAGKTTVDELASSLGKAIPSASALGVNFEELSSAMAVLTANGINTAESTTMLAALFKEMADNGADVNKIFKEISGTTIDEYIKAGHNLQDVLGELNKYLDDQDLKWGDILASSESVTAAQTLMKDGGDDLADTYARLSDDTYELDDAYESMQTPLQKLQQLQQAFKNQLIETGSAMLEHMVPALDWAIENIDTLVPLVFKLVVGFGALLIAGAVASAVNALTKSFGGLTKTLSLVGSGAKVAKGALVGVNGEVGLLAKGLTMLGPTGAIIAGVVAGAVAMGIAFDVDFATMARNAIDGVATALTGMTSAQRDYKNDVEDINENLGKELEGIQDKYNKQLEDGEITSSEARTKTVEDSVEARLQAEEEYNARYAELQKERVAEEQVIAAKSSGSKKELLDSSEQELLDLRKEWDAKNDELVLANRDGDIEAQEKISDELLAIEEKAGDEMLILKAGNRATDEDEFRSYTDNLKSEMADMTTSEKENYAERAAAGEEYRKGTFDAQLLAYDAYKGSFKTALDEQVQIEKDANDNMTTIITDSMGNQLEVTKSAKGEMTAIITDANGSEYEGTKRQKELLAQLESESWAKVLTIAAGGSDDMQTSMDNMWNGILETADTSDKKLQNKAKMSGEILGGIWLENGDITQEQYDKGISQLDEVTQNAVDKANAVEPVDIKGSIEKARKEFDKLSPETQKAIKEAEALGPVDIDSLIEEADNASSVWSLAQSALSNLGSVKVKSTIEYDKSYTGQGPSPADLNSPVPQGSRGASAKGTKGTRASGSQVAGQAGLGRINRLNDVSAPPSPRNDNQQVIYNQISLTSEIGQVNDIREVKDLGKYIVELFDEELGGLTA